MTTIYVTVIAEGWWHLGNKVAVSVPVDQTNMTAAIELAQSLADDHRLPYHRVQFAYTYTLDDVLTFEYWLDDWRTGTPLSPQGEPPIAE